MLQIIALALNTVSCTLSVDLHDFPLIDRSHIRDEFHEIKYKDVMCDVRPGLDRDIVKTIFGYIPTQDSIMSIISDNHSLNHILNSDTALGKTVLRAAFKKIVQPRPELDNLALETLISFFFEFLKQSGAASACVKPSFCLTGERNLAIPAKQLIIHLLNNRGERNMFEIFLKSIKAKLADRIAAFRIDSNQERVSTVYAVYMDYLVSHLLKKTTAERRFFGDDKNDQFEQYFVLIPKNVVTNKLANPIFDATNWINTDAIEQ